MSCFLLTKYSCRLADSIKLDQVENNHMSINDYLRTQECVTCDSGMPKNKGYDFKITGVFLSIYNKNEWG